MAPGTWRHMGDSLPVTSPEIMRKTYISIKNIYLFHMESVLLKPCHEPERSKGILKMAVTALMLTKISAQSSQLQKQMYFLNSQFSECNYVLMTTLKGNYSGTQFHTYCP